MLKRCFILCLMLCGLFSPAKADHIAGGELSYTYSGLSNGLHQYSVTLKLYRNCDAHRDFSGSAVISVFDKGTNTRVSDVSVALTRRETSSLTHPNPCITNPPRVCLEMAFYIFTLSLPATANGYVLATQVNYRIDDMNNLVFGYDQLGATYTAEIPGTAAVANGPVNTSARFVGSDLEVLCIGNRFSYSFAAQDDDGDGLRYLLCNAYATAGGGPNSSPTPPPPFLSVPYRSGYSGATPLGSDVQIDAAAGLITGTAPPLGTYVIAVCVEEIRNGVVIATQRKDIQVKTSSCTLAAAQLLPQYSLCKESKSITVSNLSTSTLINSYRWSATNNRGAVVHTSTGTTFTHTFADTGTYQLKLIVATSNGCTDSTTSTIAVYPGFRPGFTVSGRCYQTPFQFADTSRTVYGTVNSWSWDLGDGASSEDLFTVESPAYQYSITGNYNATLVVATSTGCRDTVTKTITVSDKPQLQLAFSDTLICSIDTLQLAAFGTGTFSWSSNNPILNANTATPSVFPKDTATYMVTLTEQSCVAQDSITVNVLDFITVQLPADTTICGGDSFPLLPVSEALQYQWAPASSLNDPTVKSPIATPLQTTTYHVTASLGKCRDNTSTTVNVVPYPQVAAGRDTVICYGTAAQLRGAVTAASFAWIPAAGITDVSTLEPTVTPVQTTAYVLTATDVLGCPKPGRDTVLVTVLPPVVAFAGNDTNMVAGQPLQLQATGGQSYVWSPGTGLSSTTISNPVATLNGAVDSITYMVTASVEACSDTDRITIQIFKTGADIFMPTAFTPNDDGKNDVIAPILVGMKSLEYFRVYNRWGQLVFSTGIAGRGWDGTLHGAAQRTEVFVFMVQGIDYTGKRLFKRGTFTLIR